MVKKASLKKEVKEGIKATDPLVLVNVSVRIFGNRTKAEEGEITTNLPEDYQFKQARRLFSKQVLQPLEKIRNKTRTYVYSKSVPYPLRGVVATTVQMLPTLVEEMDRLRDEFHAELEEFLEKYQNALERAERDLGRTSFKAKKYPPVEAMRSKFSFEYELYDAPSPASGLKHLSMDAYNKEVKKIEKKMAIAGDTMVAALYDRYMEFFKRCTEKMVKDKKRFKCTAFENFEAFLEDMPKLASCASDFNLRKRLDDLAAKTKKMVTAVDLDGLKEDEVYRQQLGVEFKKVEKLATELMESIPSRSIKIMKKKKAA